MCITQRKCMYITVCNDVGIPWKVVWNNSTVQCPSYRAAHCLKCYTHWREWQASRERHVTPIISQAISWLGANLTSWESHSLPAVESLFTAWLSHQWVHHFTLGNSLGNSPLLTLACRSCPCVLHIRLHSAAWRLLKWLYSPHLILYSVRILHPAL